MDDTTFRRWAWIYTHKIQALKGDKVNDYDSQQVATILTLSISDGFCLLAAIDQMALGGR